MKHIFQTAFLLLIPKLVVGQITATYNSIRPGDELIKQQVQYKNPGREGNNVIWDFGKLESINDQYNLIYSNPYLIEDSYYVMGKDSLYTNQLDTNTQLVIGTEHNTMYYYKQSDKEQLLFGHENPTTLLKYTDPVKVYQYPLNYGESFSGEFSSAGTYSSRIDFESNGKYQSKADAFGVLVLPSGDTLKHVLRIKTIQNIEEVVKGTGNQEDLHIQTLLENYKWFAKGYRYPIFETIRTINKQDSTGQDQEYFATAFFFPPQEHLYLDNDPGNEAILDSLWNAEIGKVDPEITDPDNPNPETIFTYNFYPNPVINNLTVEYYLERSSDVNISLYNTQGQLMKTINRPRQATGIHSEQVDFSSYTSGTYIISISTGYNVYSNKIVKK